MAFVSCSSYSSPSSSSSSCITRYHVFPSFHGADVRRGIVSHLHNYFASKGITTFKDQEIERSHTIGPELVKAIRESRISIVLLSKNYASSSWCLDELDEIMKCKDASGMIVMPVFYEVDPSDVRKQRGDFGNAFERTCEGKTEEDKQRWSKALAYVATIAGEHSLNWANEAEMLQKIAKDVSKTLNFSPSRDFDGMVGIEAHLAELSTLLCLESDDVKMIGIWGPAGIGKTTIARALHNLLSSNFGLSCFMGNLRGGSYRSIVGVDEYDSKLWLQNQLLSKILNQKDMRVCHLGGIKEWLQDQKVLIIFDDVDDIVQLEVLARERSWFGFGSRIIVTTEDKKILKAHEIDVIYDVGFPSKREALEMLCLSAFKQSFVRDGFEEVANKVAALCGNLPLALSVVGSSLRGESKNEWELQLSRIETSLDRKIEDVLRVGYDRLSKTNQALFLHIACFFNNDYFRSFHRLINDDVTTMLADSNLDVENGLKTLAVKSLVKIEEERYFGILDFPHQLIVMHSLLEQLGRQVVREQSDEPGKRQFLWEAKEIHHVLANETGTGSIIGISFDISEMGEFSISGRAFKRMHNLRFLRIDGTSAKMSISGDMEYLPPLKLLRWPYYPKKYLPPTFKPECLIELSMEHSNLEKLWGGIQPLTNLKRINLNYSSRLKEIPNLSKATNLKTLTLLSCTSLVELPSSIKNLHKLKCLKMWHCTKLRVIPTNINLASLEEVDMSDCSQLRTFPDLSSNISRLDVSNTKIDYVPPYISGSWLRLDMLDIGSISLKRLTHVLKCVRSLNLSNSEIKKIPDCVTGLPRLEYLTVRNCRKLVSMQSFPPSILELDATDCGSLKSVYFSFDESKAYTTLNDCKCVISKTDAMRVSSPFYNPNRKILFDNCLKLDEEAKRMIIRRWDIMSVCLPGKEVPAYFTHKFKGNSITISEGIFSASSRFKACLLLSPTEDYLYKTEVVCRLRSKGVLINELIYKPPMVLDSSSKLLTEHMFVFSGTLFKEHRCVEVDGTTSEIQFEFSCRLIFGGIVMDDKIIECGVQILGEKGESSSSKWKEQSDGAVEVSKDDCVVKSSKHTCRWGWLKKLGLCKKKSQPNLSGRKRGFDEDDESPKMRTLVNDGGRGQHSRKYQVYEEDGNGGDENSEARVLANCSTVSKKRMARESLMDMERREDGGELQLYFDIQQRKRKRKMEADVDFLDLETRMIRKLLKR